jgi:glycosyltransferase involved in cell wall biosynthesis
MKKVLHVISSLDPEAGGVSQAVRTMIKGLTAQGIQNEVASIDNPDAAYLQNEAFSVHACGPGKTAWQYAPALYSWLTEHMAAYDAVIVHALWQYQTFATYKAHRQLRGKKPLLLVMPHGMLDPYFQRAAGRKLKALRNWLFWKLIERKLVNNADALLFTCETEKILARQPFQPYNPRKEYVIGLGVEAPPPFSAGMQTAFTEKIGKALPAYWLFISRIHPKKGVDLLVQAYLELSQEYSNLPALVIAGPGLETPFGQQVRQSAAASGNIYFPGMLTGDAKWGAFYGCACFLLPSHQENFGIAVVEAMACGKPVLISDQVNIWKEIDQDKAGVVHEDHPAALKAALKKWLQVPAPQLQAYAEAAVASFHNHFTVTATTQKLVNVLKQHN